MSRDTNLAEVLTRIESRLVVGFEGLGVDVKQRAVNVEVDHTKRVISAPNAGVSLRALLKKLPTDDNVAYRVDIDGYPVCMLAPYDDTL
jgi:hypothetical protein